jgi:carbonic anhydrase
MKRNITDTLVVHCIDFRLQAYLDPWIQHKLGHGNYDRVSLAGGVFDFDTIFEQVRISKSLHEIKGVILINHEDCGAYGVDGTPERHQADLEETSRKIKTKFPDLNIETYFLHLSGEFERLSNNLP